jgi:transcriptional regulator with XRE-family HTH domain
MIQKTIQTLIHDRNVSKTDFCRHLDISRSTLNSYLSGKTAVPSNIIEMTAAYFNVPISYLFGEQNQNIDETLERLTKLENQVKTIAKKMQIEI